MRVAAIHLCRVNINKRRNPSLSRLDALRAMKVKNGITVCCVPANNNTVERQAAIPFLGLPGYLRTLFMLELHQQ